MERVDALEILDSDACSPAEAKAVLEVIGRVNRWFGGVTATQKMVEAAALAAGINRLSLLEVAGGLGETPEIVRRNLAHRGITIDVTLLDLAPTHLPQGKPSIVANALSLPFADNAFDLISCNLFAHHLQPQELRQFVREGLRVCRHAVLINDLVRHPIHLALAYAGYPLMLNRVAWLDGLTSVRRAYTAKEICAEIFAAAGNPNVQLEISRHYLFRMGITVWKAAGRT